MYMKITKGFRFYLLRFLPGDSRTFLKWSILNVNDSSYMAKIAASWTSPFKSAPVKPAVLIASSSVFTDESTDLSLRNKSRISLRPFSLGGGI